MKTNQVHLHQQLGADGQKVIAVFRLNYEAVGCCAERWVLPVCVLKAHNCLCALDFHLNPIKHRIHLTPVSSKSPASVIDTVCLLNDPPLKIVLSKSRLYLGLSGRFMASIANDKKVHQHSADRRGNVSK